MKKKTVIANRYKGKWQENEKLAILYTYEQDFFYLLTF